MAINIKTIVDAYATRVDFTDFNLADDINALQNALEALANMTFSQAAFANVETLAATETLTDDSAVVQMLNPNSADRDVNLPALAVTNHPFLIGNTNGSNYLLTVKNAGGTEIRVIAPGKFFLFFSDGNQWFYSGSDIYKTISPSQITANQNDYNPTGAYEADILRLNSDAARDITGLAGGSASRIKVVHNVGSNTITLKDENGSSTAANRFALSADIALAADQSLMLMYDVSSSRWRCISIPTPKTISAQLWLSGRGALAPTTDGFTAGTQVEMATNKQNFLLPTFPTALKKYAEWELAMPSDWDGGTVTAQFFWLANSTSGNSVVWGLAGRAYADTDTIDQAYGTAVEVTDANQTTAYKINKSGLTSAITIAGTPAAGNLVKFRAYRLGSGSDNLAVSALLVGVQVNYTRA